MYVYDGLKIVVGLVGWLYVEGRGGSVILCVWLPSLNCPNYRRCLKFATSN